jgi:3-hydroxyisobutyrate dehydrogenase-like beta-hydroxyacid dehydrogenase
MFKDAKYALGLGKSLGVEMPALSTTANIMFRSMKKELGEKDFSVIAARFQESEKDKATQ